MRIPCKTRSQKRARKKNPLRAAKLQPVKVEVKTDWETLRPLILAKSDGCYLCGRPLNLDTMTTDHVTPGKKGERKNDNLSNLMPCCRRDNFRKGSRRLTGESCPCGQKYIVKGLGCLRCERVGTDVRRTMRTTI